MSNLFSDISYFVYPYRILALVLLACWLFYMLFRDMLDNPKTDLPIVKKSAEPAMFIASDTFTGRKDGYVFKTDHKGVGYYIDH